MMESLVAIRGGRVVFPIEVGTDDDALGHAAGAVAAVDAQVGILAAEAVGVDRLLPVDAAGDGLGVGVDEQLGGIEAQAARRFPGAVDAIAVELSGLQARNVGMPDEGGLLAQLDAAGLATSAAVVETQFDLGRVFRIKAKLTPVPSQVAPSGNGFPGRQ